MTEPASGCFQCHRQGVVSTDQTNVNGARMGPNTIRFDCPSCHHSWTLSKRDALEHGAFLDRARLR